jgi:type I restriction enzyme R subunit
MAGIAESHVEEAALDWFEELGWSILHGPDIAPDEPAAERGSYSDVILRGRLEAAIDSLNPNLPREAKEEALRKFLHVDSPSLVLRNRAFHKMLTDGIPVEYRREPSPQPSPKGRGSNTVGYQLRPSTSGRGNEGEGVVDDPGGITHDLIKLIDFDNPDANDWLVVNQFTVVEGQHNRRPDIVVFVNGIPLAVIELKNPADENATIESARKQIETYKDEIPSLFTTNELLIISDGDQARMGSLTSPREWFLPWKTIEGKRIADPDDLELETLIKGVFDKRRFLDLIRHFIVFEDSDDEIVKKVAAYHQFHATRTAVDKIVAASQPDGGKKGGVVWHTQGSGKSLTMVFCAGKLVLHPQMRNPTIVVITDRNDLDDQLFGTFARCHEILRQKPVQAENRAHLRKLLNVASGGVVFSTIQKFFPEEKGDTHPCLTERDNVVVIADEAHRSQYDFIDGFARHIRDALPNATFIGFTGTPIELSDRNTYAVFGNTISVYDIHQAVEDKATVPIYYESRIANLDLPEDLMPQVDEELEEITENEEIERVEKLKSKWAALEEIVGTEKRLDLVVDDLLQHFDDRQSAMEGKAMIVCMSRRICVDVYSQIVKRYPEWASDDDEKGAIKVVMSGSASDPVGWQPHIRNKQRRDRLAKRFKDPNDSLKLVIVRDMWLTGFDVPCLHTMYIDKPMKGHTLMQGIARVNRVFRDKPGGLIVDYIGLADSLRKALANYTEGGGRGEIQYDQRQAVALMLEKLEICRDIFDGFDYQPYFELDATKKMRFARRAMNYILGLDDAKDNFILAVVGLSQAFALAVPRPEAIDVRDEVAFFQYVKASLVKNTQTTQRPEEELSAAVRQADRGQGDRAGPGDRHLRGRRDRQARHLDPLGHLPRRSAGDETAQSCGRGAAQAPERRDQAAAEDQPGPVAEVLRDASGNDPPLQEPRHRDHAGHRGAHQARQGDARGQPARREARTYDRGTRLLRYARNQRQRRQGPRRRGAQRARSRPCRHRAQEHEHRLDDEREYSSEIACYGPPHLAQIRIPTGYAEEGNRNRHSAGGAFGGGLDRE